MSETIGLKVQLNTTFEQALELTTQALKDEGFGVITDVDMQATFKNKLGVDFHPYRILGACNPKLAHQALTSDADVGMLLPCNVTVAQVDADVIEVSAINPLRMLEMIDGEVVHNVATDAYERLSRVMLSLGE